MSEAFHIGAILVVITGRALGYKHLIGHYKLLEFMTKGSTNRDKGRSVGGCGLLLEDIEKSREKCRLSLLEQKPWLKNISLEGINDQNCERILSEIIRKHGRFHNVQPL